MGDYNFTTGTQTVEELGNRMMKAQNKVDFSAHPCTAAGGVVEVLSIPAGAYVERVILRVDTAEGGTATGDLGDGTDPNGYDDAMNLNAAANTCYSSVAGTDALAEGKYYSAADTIDLSLDHDLDAGIYTVAAIYFMLEG